MEKFVILAKRVFVELYKVIFLCLPTLGRKYTVADILNIIKSHFEDTSFLCRIT